jgi:AMMECR1 domain-containing protein
MTPRRSLLNHRDTKAQRFSFSFLCASVSLWLAFFIHPALADALRHSLENPRVQKAALSLARRALVAHFDNEKVLVPPADLPAALETRAGVIVTIEKKGRVAPRGCRGTLQPRYANLGEEIIRNAIAAATRDAREKPLQKNELAQCRISLTFILSIHPIQNLAQHDVARCGLIAQRGERIGLVLPYEGKDAQTQWQWARRKAGLEPHEKAQMLEVEAVRFREP